MAVCTRSLQKLNRVAQTSMLRRCWLHWPTRIPFPFRRVRSSLRTRQLQVQWLGLLSPVLRASGPLVLIRRMCNHWPVRDAACSKLLRLPTLHCRYWPAPGLNSWSASSIRAWSSIEWKHVRMSSNRCEHKFSVSFTYYFNI